MSRRKLLEILEAHSVGFEEVDGRIMADDLLAFAPASYTDVTDLDPTALRQWLGY